MGGVYASMSDRLLFASGDGIVNRGGIYKDSFSSYRLFVWGSKNSHWGD